MAEELRICRAGNHSFTVTEEDLEFYRRLSPAVANKRLIIPPPTICPACRRQHRFAFRNERVLYNRQSSLSGKSLISMYSPDKPFKVYASGEWWSDVWDAAEYGRPYDFRQSFFEQFRALIADVPRIALVLVNVENSDYCNYTGDVKNSYLCFGSIFAQDCYYGSPYYCEDCVDVLVTRESKHCYECVDCEILYECLFCQDCANSQSLLCCYSCQACRNCIGCVDLRNRRWCIFNEQLSEEEYKRHWASQPFSRSLLARITAEMEKLKAAALKRAVVQRLCENSSGSYLNECKNVKDSFYVRRAEDCKWLMQTIDMKDCCDVNYMEEAELVYNSLGAYREKEILFSNTIYGSSSMFYCDSCVAGCSNCFGCSGLKKKHHCILNRPYTVAEYEAIVCRIVDQMREYGEWGEFFPLCCSPYGYNETVAQEYFPLTKEQALNLGANWYEDGKKERVSAKIETPPDSAAETTEEMVSTIYSCTSCSRPYRIIAAEYRFYRRMSLPAPAFCPDCRHRARLARRTPQQLQRAVCARCSRTVESRWPSREQVLCEECYFEHAQEQ